MDINFRKAGERGLGFQLHVTCLCSETILNSCRLINKSFEINRKIVFVMRLVGVGLNGINLFCSLMDICSGLSTNAYYGALNNISIALKAVYDRVVDLAAKEEKQKNVEVGNPELQLIVSGDGTWAKRGFSSLYGVITLIGKYSNKVLDLIIKSSYCKACNDWKNKTNTPEYEIWHNKHENECTANHEGSAGKMEVDGVINMFQRSEIMHGVKYANYIGDGDSKTFKSLLDAQPYGADFVINKLECVLHVGKRMYKRLKDAKKNLTQLQKAEKQLQGKTAKNKGAPKGKMQKAKKQPGQKAEKTAKFTDKLIRDMSTYYNLAIQRYPDSVEDMKKEIWAGFYHKISTDDKPQHNRCDISWCKYLQNKAAKKPFSHKPAIAPEVQEIIRPIYESLTSDELLQRCLGRNTQNNNKSFNNCLWQLAPKHMFCGKNTIEIAAWISACLFNEGYKPLLSILDIMGVSVGEQAVRYAENRNRLRVKQAERRSSNDSKEARTQRKKNKAEQELTFQELEGLLYGAGIAD